MPDLVFVEHDMNFDVFEIVVDELSDLGHIIWLHKSEFREGTLSWE